MTLTREPNYESHFIKYATTLYNEVPKPIQEAEKYCAIVPKLKRYLFDKTLTRSLSNGKKKKKIREKKRKRKKGGPEGGVWKEKRIFTLMHNLAVDFINCVCFPARSTGVELTFLCT